MNSKDLMVNEIKAIQTRYNGYWFRSRLEARWAVFFDVLGIKYEYEPEGFKLGDNICYLPDFYLPVFAEYIEIKPEGDQRFALHLGSLLTEKTKKKVYLISGIPGLPYEKGEPDYVMEHPYVATLCEPNDVWTPFYWWACCPYCYALKYRNIQLAYLGQVDCSGCCEPKTDGRAVPILIDAYTMARSTRFSRTTQKRPYERLK